MKCSKREEKYPSNVTIIIVQAKIGSRLVPTVLRVQDFLLARYSREEPSFSLRYKPWY